MPDITMCSGKGCSLKDSCWRHNATPTPDRQSFFLSPPLKDDDSACDYYWPLDVQKHESQN